VEVGVARLPAVAVVEHDHPLAGHPNG
jgi:hypothetical protein